MCLKMLDMRKILIIPIIFRNKLLRVPNIIGIKC
jgi:hypothetical protein